MGDEARCGGWIGKCVVYMLVERVGKEMEVEGCDVGVGNEDVGGCGEGGEEGGCDVVVEVKPTVDGVSTEDGDLVHICQVGCRAS